VFWPLEPLFTVLFTYNHRVPILNPNQLNRLASMADLEAAALSGDLFRPRSPSPTRSASTASPVNTDDELGSDLSDSPPHSPSVNASQANLLPREGAQTGPKGVIEDRRAENLRVMAERKAVLRRTRLEQKQRAIIAETVEEEAQRREREAREEEDARVRWRRNRREELELERREQNEGGNGVVTKRGGLREVGQGGFVLAVERVGWVVVLIYEPVRLVITIYDIVVRMADGKRTSPGVKLSSQTCSTSPSTSLPPTPSHAQLPSSAREPPHSHFHYFPTHLPYTQRKWKRRMRRDLSTTTPRRIGRGGDPTRTCCLRCWRTRMGSWRGRGSGWIGRSRRMGSREC
jgi:hypothetical protein